MLELRYNGCSGCRDSAEAILRAAGFFPGINYRVEFHGDHRTDKIYKKRPDYLTEFSGAILINPETMHWIDFYTMDRMKLAIKCENEDDAKKVAKLVAVLGQGQ